MSIVYPSADIVVTANAISESGGTLSVSSNDRVVIDSDINIVATAGDAINSEVRTLDVRVEGDVVASGGAIDLDFDNTAADTSYHYSVSIGETGTVTGGNRTIYVGSNNHSTVRLGSIAIDNAGEVNGYASTAVLAFYAASASVSNSGSMNTFDNSGSFLNAVRYYGVETAYLNNTGLLQNVSGLTGNDRETATVSFSTGTAIVSGINAGLITGGDVSFYSDATDSESFVNSGTMTGDVYLSTAIGGSFANSGHIGGDVYLKGGNDTFDGRGGTVDGSVNGGAGDDTYYVDNAQLTLVEQSGQGVDTVNSSVNWRLGDTFEDLTLIGDGNIRGIGNGENNTLTGNIGDNRLRGQGGNDIVSGADGDDKAWGGAGADDLFGDDGDDVLHGGLNNDKMYGNDDNDVLYGNRNNDTLYGGDGDDRLIGGLGTDKLYGGQGEDEFVFNRVNDSTDTSSADIISDFVVGEDVIDLRGLAGSHSYIGTGAFSGAAGEVQAISTGSITRVKVDLDGDGSADMKIMVVGTIDLTAGEFLL